MLKQKILLTTILASSLFASSIELNLAKQQDPKRLELSNNSMILSYNKSIKEASKSIVNIATKQKIRNIDHAINQIFNDPLFKQFFGNSFIGDAVASSLGSGVVITKDGYIVTNANIVKGANEITVSFDKTKKYIAQVVGIDDNSNLAVIKIDATNLHPIKIGSSKHLLLGDVVFSLGNPYGLSTIVSKGIISSVNKDTLSADRYENFIQTDAKINPQNAGGALCDSRGVLIGINHSSSNNMGFVTPVSKVKEIVKNIIENGKVIKGYLGVVVSNVNKNLKKVYHNQKGVLVLDIEDNSPAYLANIKRGDLIYAINNKTITNQKSFNLALDNFAPNDTITLKIQRDNKNIQIRLKLSSKHSITKSALNKVVLDGLYVSKLDHKNMAKFNITQDEQGVLIDDVKAGSKAEKVGFLAGDVIIQIEDIEVVNLKTLNKALKRYKNKEKRVYINRYGKILITVLQ